jgi:hypothetical protein
MKEKKYGTFIDGIACSQHLDSSGERIMIKGVDISSLATYGLLNWEHKNDTASQIVGKILEAKKIMQKSDCENERHEHFWDKSRMPFVYIAGELFDHVGHTAAKDVAAMLEYDSLLNKKETKPLIHFSIEGSRLAKTGSNIDKCIARRVTITNLPCNKMASAEKIESIKKSLKNPKSADVAKEILSKFKKTEERGLVEIFKGEKKYYSSLVDPKTRPNPSTNPKSKSNYVPQPKSSVGQRSMSSGSTYKPKREFSSVDAPDKTKLGDRTTYTTSKPKTGHSIYNDPSTFNDTSKPKQNWKTKMGKTSSFYTSNVRKAIVASCGGGAPEGKTGGAALQKECLDKSKVLKSLSNEAWGNYKYQEKLLDFISERYPEMNKNEVLAVCKTYVYTEQIKQELLLKGMVE